MKETLYGYAGKVLFIDLTKGKLTTKNIPKDLYRELIGGQGFGAWYLYNLIDPKIDPLFPENALIFSTGPLTGTLIPLASRYNVNFKSPLTGLYGVCQSGGYFPNFFKHSGYDVVIVKGRAEKPVFLWIDDGAVEIKSAMHLWGKDTFETEEIVKEELGDKRRIYVASIGPAGERLVRYATIQNEKWHAAGRAGPGAVMGSKNLKAIAVRGGKRPEIYDPDGLRDFLAQFSKEIRENPSAKTYHDYGTHAGTNLVQKLGVYPTRYWSKGTFDKYYEINSDALQSRIFVRNDACFNCPIACGRYVRLKEGRYAGLEDVPDYEGYYSFGSLCEVGDIDAVTVAHYLCDRYGMDVISAGNSIAFAMYLYERGKLKSEKPIKFGDSEGLLELLKDIAFRKGIGDLLAEGTREMERRLGVEGLAIHMKGLEPPGYDMRGLKGVGLAFSVAARGACHMRASFYDFELKGQIDRFTMDPQKAELLKEREDWVAVMDSMVFCRLGRAVLSWENMLKMVNFVTGFGYSLEELKLIGERIVNISRLFNIEAGLRRKDDYPAKRFMEEPLPDGPAKGHVIDPKGYEDMLNRYYEVRGWNKNGIPTEEKLKALSL